MSATLTRAQVPHEFKNVDEWQNISLDNMGAAERARHESWVAIITAYAKGEPVAELLREKRFHFRQLLRLFTRCVSLDGQGVLYGWRGLLKGVARKAPVRTAAVTSPRNATGALTQLFAKHPSIEDKLRRLVLKLPVDGEIPEARIMNKHVHVAFLKLCAAAGIPRTGWPFSGETQGARSIDTFIKRVVERAPIQGVAARYGEVAATRLCTGTGEARILLADACLDVAELDAQRLDAIGTVSIPTASGMVDVAAERLILLLMCDGKESTILSYYVVVKREPSAEDLLTSASFLVKPWEPVADSNLGLEYWPGAGLPYGGIAGVGMFAPCALVLDNALVHLSYAVIERLARRLGCALNWGPVRKWMRRPVVERIFRSLEQRGFHRLPSTTGGSPTDTRRQDPVAAARKFKITLDELIALIDVEIANFNATPSESRFGLTPNEAFAHSATGSPTIRLFPTLPPTGALNTELDIAVFQVRVRGSLAKGVRPYFRFKRAVYTSKALANDYSLVGTSLIVHLDRNDIRTGEIFRTDTHASLGIASVRGPWRLRAHSLETRRQVCKLSAKRRLDLHQYPDPVTAYLAYLANKASRKGAAPKGVSEEASQLARDAIEQKSTVEDRVGGKDAPVATPVAAPVRSRHAIRLTHSVVGADNE